MTLFFALNHHPNSQEFFDSLEVAPMPEQTKIKCEYCDQKFFPHEFQDHQITNHRIEIEEAFKWLIKCEHCKCHFKQAELQEHQDQCCENKKPSEESTAKHSITTSGETNSDEIQAISPKHQDDASPANNQCKMSVSEKSEIANFTEGDNESLSVQAWRLQLMGQFQQLQDQIKSLSLYDSRKIQVNLCQKHLFLHQLTHNMTTECSLNYEFST